MCLTEIPESTVVNVYMIVKHWDAKRNYDFISGKEEIYDSA